MSKDELTDLIMGSNKKFRISDFCRTFGLKGEQDRNDLFLYLKELEEEGRIYTEHDECIPIHLNQNIKMATLDLSSGTDGFVVVDKVKYKVLDDHLNGALHGDLVIVNLLNNNFAMVKKVVKRKKESYVYVYDGTSFLPYHFKSKYNVIVSGNTKNLLPGSRVLVTLANSLDNGILRGEIVELIGHKDDPDIELKTIAITNGFNPEFSEEVKKEVLSIPKVVREEDKVNRRDLTRETIFTIDGSHTKDIDDAISLTKENGIYTLGVHIADVSHYVKKGSAIDKEAAYRGNSLYMLDTSIPMLPRELSNGICSLNEGVERLAMSCIMKINSDGKVIDYEIVPSVIKSQKKMTYEDVNKILLNNETVEGYEEFVPNLKLMEELSNILNNAKEKRGYLSFESSETEVLTDESGNIIGFKPREQKVAEKIIENFMLEANETIATHAYFLNIPMIFRVHDKPDSERFKEILDTVEKMGYTIKMISNYTNSKAIHGILKSLSNYEEYPILSQYFLQGMRRATYDIENIGHFGLALDYYTHFTSPIRRYVDLIVHRLLKLFINYDITKMSELKIADGEIGSIAVYASERERRADKAEEEANNMAMAAYMEDHIGECFDAVITSIGKSGLCVTTSNHIKGKVTYAQTPGYYYDKNTCSAVSKGANEPLGIGDVVRIKALDASKEFRTIKFSIIDKLKKEEKRLILSGSN